MKRWSKHHSILKKPMITSKQGLADKLMQRHRTKQSFAWRMLSLVHKEESAKQPVPMVWPTWKVYRLALNIFWQKDAISHNFFSKQMSDELYRTLLVGHGQLISEAQVAERLDEATRTLLKQSLGEAHLIPSKEYLNKLKQQQFTQSLGVNTRLLFKERLSEITRLLFSQRLDGISRTLFSQRLPGINRTLFSQQLSGNATFFSQYLNELNLTPIAGHGQLTSEQQKPRALGQERAVHHLLLTQRLGIVGQKQIAERLDGVTRTLLKQSLNEITRLLFSQRLDGISRTLFSQRLPGINRTLFSQQLSGNAPTFFSQYLNELNLTPIAGHGQLASEQQKPRALGQERAVHHLLFTQRLGIVGQKQIAERLGEVTRTLLKQSLSEAHYILSKAHLNELKRQQYTQRLDGISRTLFSQRQNGIRRTLINQQLSGNATFFSQYLHELNLTPLVGHEQLASEQQKPSVLSQERAVHHLLSKEYLTELKLQQFPQRLSVNTHLLLRERLSEITRFLFNQRLPVIRRTLFSQQLSGNAPPLFTQYLHELNRTLIAGHGQLANEQQKPSALRQGKAVHHLLFIQRLGLVGQKQIAERLGEVTRTLLKQTLSETHQMLSKQHLTELKRQQFPQRLSVNTHLLLKERLSEITRFLFSQRLPVIRRTLINQQLSGSTPIPFTQYLNELNLTPIAGHGQLANEQQKPSALRQGKAVHHLLFTQRLGLVGQKQIAERLGEVTRTLLKQTLRETHQMLSKQHLTELKRQQFPQRLRVNTHLLLKERLSEITRFLFSQRLPVIRRTLINQQLSGSAPILFTQYLHGLHRTLIAGHGQLASDQQKPRALSQEKASHHLLFIQHQGIVGQKQIAERLSKVTRILFKQRLGEVYRTLSIQNPEILVREKGIPGLNGQMRTLFVQRQSRYFRGQADKYLPIYQKYLSNQQNVYFQTSLANIRDSEPQISFPHLGARETRSTAFKRPVSIEFRKQLRSNRQQVADLQQKQLETLKKQLLQMIPTEKPDVVKLLMQSPELGRVVDKIYTEIERKLRFESQRRGF